MTTAFYSHSDCRGHDMGRGHPECPERLDAIEDHLIATGLDLALERREAPLVDPADLALAHSSGFVAELRDVLEQVTQAGERCAIDADTIAAPGTSDSWLASEPARTKKCCPWNRSVTGQMRLAIRTTMFFDGSVSPPLMNSIFRPVRIRNAPNT